VKFIINDQMVLLRAPEGPLEPYIIPFSKWATGQGYARCSLRQRVRIAAHQFRHGLATEMLRHGASLSEVGELLGHRSPETTKIYTKVDLDALRTLALPWPGGVR
jgi:integrase